MSATPDGTLDSSTNEMVVNVEASIATPVVDGESSSSSVEILSPASASVTKHRKVSSTASTTTNTATGTTSALRRPIGSAIKRKSTGNLAETLGEPTTPTTPATSSGASTARAPVSGGSGVGVASKLKLPTSGLHAKKSSVGSNTSRDSVSSLSSFSSASSTGSTASPAPKKKPLGSTSALGAASAAWSPLPDAKKKNSLPKKTSSALGSTSTGAVTVSKVGRASISSIPVMAGSTPGTPTSAGSAGALLAHATVTPATPATATNNESTTAPTTPAPAATSLPASASPPTASPLKRPSTATSTSASSSAIAKKRPSSSAITRPGVGLGLGATRALGLVPPKKSASLSATGTVSSTAANTTAVGAVRRTTSSTTSSPIAVSKRPHSASIHSAPVPLSLSSTSSHTSSPASSAPSSRGGSKVVSLNTASSQVLTELAQLKRDHAELQSKYDALDLETTRLRFENVELQGRLQSSSSSSSLGVLSTPPLSPSSVSTPSAAEVLAASQTTKIHQLTNSLKNIEQAMQAQREQVEGSMGFAPFAQAGKPISQSTKDKKFEETIQDLQFQILYGDTATNIALARLTESHLASQAHAKIERIDYAKLKGQLAKKHEERIEQWIGRDNFVNVM